MTYCKTIDTNGPHCLFCQGLSLPDTLLRVTVPPYCKLQLRALAFSALFLPYLRFHLLTVSRTRTREAGSILNIMYVMRNMVFG